MTDANAPVVLAVDDDEKLLETYEMWLASAYDLRTADDGESARRALDDDVDVVLLDRLMPDLTGDDLLEEIRDRGLDCRVAMVTAVEPDFDIADMPFDAYVSKAVDRETVRDTVERLVARSQRDERLREHYAVAEKLAALEARKTEAELAESAAYRDLIDQFEELDEALADDATALDRDDIVADMARAERTAERLDGDADRREETL